MKALEVAGNWTQEIEDKFNAILGNAPEADMDFRVWAPFPSRRQVALDLKIASKTGKVAFNKY